MYQIILGKIKKRKRDFYLLVTITSASSPTTKKLVHFTPLKNPKEGSSRNCIPCPDLEVTGDQNDYTYAY